MQEKSTYKSKNLKLKESFKLSALLILLIFMISGCVKKVPIDINNPLKVKLIYPKKTEQSTFVKIGVKLTNQSIYPITVLNIQLSNPDTTSYYRGTDYLEALKHKFIKNKKFTIEYFENKKLAGRKEHVVPEVHKLKSIVYPGKTKIFYVKALAQNLNSDTYKNDITITYITLDKTWNNKIYKFKGKSKPDKNTVVKELYETQKTLPKKLEGNLIASSDLGKAKSKNLKFSIKLSGRNIRNNPVKDAEYYVYLKKQDVWIYNTSEGSFINDKNNKTQKIKGFNIVKPFIKTIMKGHATVHVPQESYKTLEQEMKPYGFILKQSYFDAKMNTDQLYEFLSNLLKKGYAFHKHGEVLKINN